MTVEIKPVMVGTEVNITQEGLPDVIPVEACYLGWQESLFYLDYWLKLKFQINKISIQ